MLEKIGGFGHFADELADDYAIGMAVRSAGYDVVIAPFLVGHVCFETSLRASSFGIRFASARTVKTIDPIGYAGTILTHPLPLALLGMLSGSRRCGDCWRWPHWHRASPCADVSNGGSDCRGKSIGLSRCKTSLLSRVYVASYFGATVHWRGAEYRVATDGTLIEDDPRRP